LVAQQPQRAGRRGPCGGEDDLDGYKTTYSDQQHVKFAATDGHVFEPWYQNDDSNDNDENIEG
jgi:hypothetical protein